VCKLFLPLQLIPSHRDQATQDSQYSSIKVSPVPIKPPQALHAKT
jgi:hypothetical protein